MMTAAPWTKEYTPGDALTALERAVVDAAFLQTPALRNASNDNLNVTCRNYTVHGMYVEFRAEFVEDEYPKDAVLQPLNIFIDSKSIEGGGCAIVYFLGEWLLGLELVSHVGTFGLPVSAFSIVWHESSTHAPTSGSVE